MNMHSDPRRYWSPPILMMGTAVIGILCVVLGYFIATNNILSDCQNAHRFVTPNAVYVCEEIKDGLE